MLIENNSSLDKCGRDEDRLFYFLSDINMLHPAARADMGMSEPFNGSSFQ